MIKRKNIKDDNLTYRTYNAWIKLGFCVKKGEKSNLRNKYGQALFNENQVTVIEENIEPYAFDYMWK